MAGIKFFHHTLHIYHQIWAKFDKGSEHNAIEHLIPSKSAHDRSHNYLGCKWNYMYLFTDILFSVSLSFLLLHHHSSLGIGVAISYKYSYSCMFKYQLADYHYSTLHKHHITFTIFSHKGSFLEYCGWEPQILNWWQQTPLSGTMQPI
jgi:hypothetical protein